jgi:hypothetical protein
VSQFVWTCGCGWRSTSENSARGVRGHAPVACRRCGSTTLKVTSEKHPKITNVCKDCREDFIGWIGGKYCKRCMPKHRGAKIWDGKRKYDWTPERDQILKDHYKNNPTDIATRFFPGWPKFAIAHRAQQLGLCRVKEKPWTKAEDQFIREHAGVHTPHWMRQQLRTRTVTAIVVRLRRLQISRRIQADGLTLRQQAIGVDHRQIAAWWKSGRLKGTYRTNSHEHERYEFQESDIAQFVLDNPSSFRLDRVDQAWFMTLMRDAVRGQVSEATIADQAIRPQPRAEAKKRKPAAAAAPPSVEQLVPCVGADGAPCQSAKQVASRRNIPARCPDCMLAFRRSLHAEERERLKRIRAVSAPPHESVAS